MRNPDSRLNPIALNFFNATGIISQNYYYYPKKSVTKNIEEENINHEIMVDKKNLRNSPLIRNSARSFVCLVDSERLRFFFKRRQKTKTF